MRTKLILLGVLTAFPIALGAQDVATVRAAIDRGNAAYIRAFANADGDALAAVYDALGARLSSNGIVAQGHPAISADVGRFVNRVGSVDVDLETVDLWVVNDLAFETGIWRYAYTPPGEPQRTTSGRYVTVWKRQVDGSYKMLGDLNVPGTAGAGLERN